MVFLASLIVQKLILKLSCQTLYLLFCSLFGLIYLVNLFVDLFRIPLPHFLSQVEMIERRYLIHLSVVELSECFWIPF